jgi:AP endonuclease-2
VGADASLTSFGVFGPIARACILVRFFSFRFEAEKKMTCVPSGWNTKISARESNYGTRIDYILATPGLLPWIKAADIQPEIKGSDHCPVFIDLHDQIVDASGVNLSLKDAMHFRQGTEPPRLAARFWDEYSGKQRLLDTFFGKKKADPTPVVPNPVPSLVPKPSPASEDVQDQHSLPSTSQDSSASGATLKRKSSTYTATTTTSFKKPKKDSAPAKIQKTGQASLAAFFTKPLASSSKSKPPIDDSDMLDADYRLALSLSQEQESTLPPPRASSSSNDGSKKAWTTLLAPIQPPKCIVHGEPTKEFTVNKPGPNKGKNFFICAR